MLYFRCHECALLVRLAGDGSAGLDCPRCRIHSKKWLPRPWLEAAEIVGAVTSRYPPVRRLGVPLKVVADGRRDDDIHHELPKPR